MRYTAAAVETWLCNGSCVVEEVFKQRLMFDLCCLPETMTIHGHEHDTSKSQLHGLRISHIDIDSFHRVLLEQIRCPEDSKTKSLVQLLENKSMLNAIILSESQF